MHKPSNLKRRRGYLLLWVMAMIVVMLALMAALHHYEVVSRRVSDQATAELQFLQARRWELARLYDLVPANWVPRLDVTGSTRCVANGTLIAEDAGANIFEKTQNYVYTTFPNLEIARGDAHSDTPPPFHQLYRSRPTSWASALPKKDLDSLATTLSPVAAYAPRGSISLDSCCSWSSAPLNADKAFDRPTGEAPLVVAGNDIRVPRFPYGRVHTREGRLLVDKSGLVLPSGGLFPQQGFETDLFAKITSDVAGSLMHDLREASEKMDDKTHLIDDEPPWLSEIGKDKNNILRLLSVRSSLDFKFYSLPQPIEFFMGQTKRIFILAPYPPDPKDVIAGSRLDFLNKSLKEARGRAKELFDKKMGYAIRLRYLKGGLAQAADPRTGQEALPEVQGLLRDFQSLRRALQTDLSTLQARESTGQTDTCEDLKSNQALLLWLATVGPNGFANPNNPKPAILQPIDARAKIPGFVHNSNNAYPRAQVAPLILNGLYARLKLNEKGMPTYNDQTLKDTDPIPLKMWEEILFNSPNDPVDPSRVSEGPLTRLQQQKLFLSFLLDDSDSQNPWTKTKDIVASMETNALAFEADLQTTNALLDELRKEINKEAAKSIVPKHIKADDTLALANPKFRNNEGLPGSAYMPYGIDIFLIIDLIRDYMDDRLPETWMPRWPVVFMGDPGELKPQPQFDGGLSFDDKGTTIEAEFTVPAGHSFHYAHSLTLKGDLWLERGSSMVVRGKLTMVDPLKGKGQFTWQGGTGRIIMEPGSTLVVDGDLKGAGTRLVGSVLMLTEGGRVDPISCAILCGGNLNLPYGMSNGMNFHQLFCTMGVGDNPAVARFAEISTQLTPFMGKIFGPFFERHSFFCEMCPEWEFRPWVIVFPWFTPPFFISFTVYIPWDVPPTHANPWNPVFGKLSWFYSKFDNLVLGENLFKHSRWYMAGHGPLLLLVPKISPSQLLPSRLGLDQAPPTDDLPKPEQLTSQLMTSFQSESENLATALHQIAHKQSPQSMPAAASFPVPDTWVKWFEFVLRLYNGVSSWAYYITPEVLVNGMACETSGALVYGKTITIGLDDLSRPIDNQALMASGLFLADKDINIHAIHTIGCVISQGGSINPRSDVHTELLANPQFTRAYLNHIKSALFSPQKLGVESPALQGGDLKSILRLFDFRYGGNPLLPKPNPMFFQIPGPLRLTQQGYIQ